jgi:hypothetical protein
LDLPAPALGSGAGGEGSNCQQVWTISFLEGDRKGAHSKSNIASESGNSLHLFDRRLSGNVFDVILQAHREEANDFIGDPHNLFHFGNHMGRGAVIHLDINALLLLFDFIGKAAFS